MSRNNILLTVTSIGFALLYVVAPVYAEFGTKYEQWVDALWALYVYVLPGVIGVAVALLFSGPFGERVTKILLALAVPVIVAFLWSGRSGLDLGSFRISMIFLAFTGAIYAAAGGIAAFVATRRRSTAHDPGRSST